MHLEGTLSSSSPSPRKGISVIVPSHNEGQNLRRTVHSLLATLPPNGEIVVVDDSSTDGSTSFLEHGYGALTVTRPSKRLGVAGARNHGASLASGEVLVFSDAHVEAPIGWIDQLCAPLKSAPVGIVGPVISAMGNRAIKGYGQTWSGPNLEVQWLTRQALSPYPVPLLGGGFMAMRRDFFDETGGFDTGMTTWGMEDSEICLRAWLLGYQCVVVPTAEVAHLFRSEFPYAVDWEMVMHNILRLVGVHFSQERFAQVTASLAQTSGFPRALARLIDSDAFSRRAEFLARRQFDDAWFFDRFNISFGPN